MSADLELCQLGLADIRVPPVKTRQAPESCSATDDNSNSSSSSSGSNIVIQQQTAGNDSDGCRTPTSKEHKIPAILSCPPAPRKPRRAVSCKRKLSEFEFFEIVNREEVDSFFQSCFVAVAKRRCPL